MCLYLYSSYLAAVHWAHFSDGPGATPAQNDVCLDGRTSSAWGSGSVSGLVAACASAVVRLANEGQGVAADCPAEAPVARFDRSLEVRLQTYSFPGRCWPIRGCSTKPAPSGCQGFLIGPCAVKKPVAVAVSRSRHRDMGSMGRNKIALKALWRSWTL